MKRNECAPLSLCLSLSVSVCLPLVSVRLSFSPCDRHGNLTLLLGQQLHTLLVVCTQLALRECLSRDIP